MTFLSPTDPDPVIAHNRGSSCPWLIICDHAGRRTPQSLGDLGLPALDWERHIAYDIGAFGLAEALAERLGGATVIAQAYSRLVIDCNRDPARPDAIVRIADASPVQANQALDAIAREARQEAIHTPYHRAISVEIDARMARGTPPALVLIHSFTPVMAGRARPWQVGVLHQRNRLSLGALDWLRGRPDLVVGDNQPYAMDEIDYTAPTHAGARGLEYLELETRQDLIAEDAGQARFADLYARMLGNLAP